MNRLLPLMLAALLAPMTVSADWVDDTPFVCFPANFESSCPDPLLCVEDAPPQVVDTALHCADVAPSRAPGVVDSVTYYTYERLEDWTTHLVYNPLDNVYEDNQQDLSEVNNVLCNVVWSHFCTNPLEYPEWQDVPDPFGPYPL